MSELRDRAKATNSSIMGIEIARQNLGAFEEQGGNEDRSMRHYMISAKRGCNESLESVTVSGKE